MGTEVLNFRAGTLEPALRERANVEGATLSATAKRDLGRYYAVMASELTLATFTEAEWNLIREVCSGTAWDESSYNYLWAEIEDGCRLDNLAEKWEVDGASLVKRVRALGAAGAMAIIDATERWWGEQRKQREGEQA